MRTKGHAARLHRAQENHLKSRSQIIMATSKKVAPKLKGFNNPFRVEYYAVNLDAIDSLGSSEVDPAKLVSGGVAHKGQMIKVLGRGKITRAVKVSAHAVSKSAQEAIVAAGGSVVILPPTYKGVRPPAKGSQFTNR
ncbi:MAG: 50S ribosomal protein L15 [Actinobacteria bacterium]|nr:50S ribosomal protein L15 [Actinomycetota bacterium]